MITHIKVDGFKTLSDFSLSLQPGLNVLVGPNGSGKTNIVSFFEFLAHLVESNPSEATSRLGGAGAVFRRVDDTYQANISATVLGTYPLDQVGVSGGHFPPRPQDKGKYAQYEYSFKLLFSNELEAVVFARQQFRYKISNSLSLLQPASSQAENWDLDIEISLGPEMNPQAKVRNIDKDLGEILPFFRAKSDKEELELRQTEEFFENFNPANTSIPSTLFRFNPRLLLLADDLAGGQTFNIIPSRVKVPEDSAKPPGIASDGSGLSATLYSLKRRDVAPQFRHWFSMYSSRQGSLKRPTLETLKAYFQLANSSIEDIDVTNDPFNNQLRVSFHIKNGDYTAGVPLSLMSDGTLKWITLLTAALTASSVFSIEEPENFLHPQMQGQFVKIMREVLFKERQAACTLMTTHSETVLNNCKPKELVVVVLRDGKTVAYRCSNESELSDEIEKTGFGLGYYYIAGAIQDV